jgi:hypothetical protein
MYKDRHAERTEVRTGVSDGDWIEVVNLQHAKASRVGDLWTQVSGSEQVIFGDLSSRADGAPVEVVTAVAEPKVASANPPVNRVLTASAPIAPRSTQ